MNRIPGSVLPHYDLQLRRGGRVVRMEWDEEAANHAEVFIHPSEFPAFLDATVCVADDVSLQDIMIMIERNGELFADVAACEHIGALLDDMRNVSEEDTDGMPVSLEIGWSATIIEGLLQFGPLLSGRTEDGEPVDVAFAPLPCIADLPIILDESFVVVDDEDPSEAVFVSRCMLTLLDVVKGVLDELTQLGSPEEKRQAVDELRAAMQGMENGSVSGYTEEEVMERAALQAEEARRRFPCRVCGEDFRCACFGKPHGLCHACFTNMKES